MLMTHRRPQRKLHINRECDPHRQESNRREFFRPGTNFIERPPKGCRYKRDHDEQREKGLRNARMKDADFVLQHRDAQATKNSLQEHTCEPKQAEIADPSAAVAAPKPDPQNDREEPDSSN